MLFRQEAIDHSTDKLGGDVLLIPKVSYVLLTLFLVAWVGLMIAWLVSSQYSRKETVMGWVEPNAGIVKVYSPTSDGVFEEIFISEGEHVRAGQRLALMRNSKDLAGAGELSELIEDELIQQRLLLTQQKERTINDYPVALQNVRDQLASTNDELREMRKQMVNLQQQESLIATETNKLKTLLDKQLISQTEFNKSNKELLLAQGGVASLSRELERQSGVVKDIENKVMLFPTTHKNKLAELDSRLNELNQRSLQVSAEGQVVIKAPVSGVVDSIQGAVGQRASRTTPILSLMPHSTQFKVTLLVPIKSVGFIEVGQLLDVRYDAFPYQKFGTYKATVTKVSAHVLLPNEILSLPADIKEAVYKVEAKLEENTVLAYGKEVQLRSGMTLAADVYLGERSLVEWLLEPLLSLRGKFQ